MQKKFEELGIILPGGASAGFFAGTFEANDGVIDDITISATKWDYNGPRPVEVSVTVQLSRLHWLWSPLVEAIEDRYGDDIAATEKTYRLYRDEMPGGTSAGRTL